MAVMIFLGWGNGVQKALGQVDLGFGIEEEEEDAEGEEGELQPGSRPKAPDDYFEEEAPEGFTREPFPVIPSPENIEDGKLVYFTKCVWCHGVEGAGDGPGSDRLFPRPRNFQQGTFKIRRTASGELPLREDLFRTVSNGLPGSVMPSWEGILTEEQIRNVISFITTKLIVDRNYTDTEYESFTVLQLEKLEPLPPTQENIQRGHELFNEKKCLECHGTEGRGDGNPINLKDDWAFPIQPRDLHKCWNIRGSRRDPYNIKNIFRTFSTGLNGTPMPSFADNTTVEERWQLANFVLSLCERDEHGNPLEIDRATNKPKVNPVISSQYVNGAIPDNPEAKEWKNVPRRWVALGGQLAHKPRNFLTRIDDLWVRSLYNDTHISFLIQWDDRIKSVASDPLPWKDTEVNLQKYGVTEAPPRTGSNPGTSDTKVSLQEYGVLKGRPGEKASLAGKQNTYKIYNDAVAIQFPITWKGLDPSEKPKLFWGDSDHPVDLMKWSADGAMRAYKGTGWNQEFQRRAFGQQVKVRKAEWKNGRWTVILQRPLKGERGKDTTFEAGSLIPVAFFAWDGNNGDAGRKMSLSPYYYMLLQPKTGAPLKLQPPEMPKQATLSPHVTFQVGGEAFDSKGLHNPFLIGKNGKYDPKIALKYLPGGGKAHLVKPEGNPWESDDEGYMKAVREGGEIYFQNCHFCHADNLNGKEGPTGGFFSFASIPQPTAFSTNGILKQLKEWYTFWRIAKGTEGLPKKGGQWASSTMPAMEEHLTTEDMWKVTSFLYWQTGTPSNP